MTALCQCALSCLALRFSDLTCELPSRSARHGSSSAFSLAKRGARREKEKGREAEEGAKDVRLLWRTRVTSPFCRPHNDSKACLCRVTWEVKVTATRNFDLPVRCPRGRGNLLRVKLPCEMERDTSNVSPSLQCFLGFYMQ